MWELGWECVHLIYAQREMLYSWMSCTTISYGSHCSSVFLQHTSESKGGESEVVSESTKRVKQN